MEFKQTPLTNTKSLLWKDLCIQKEYQFSLRGRVTINTVQLIEKKLTSIAQIFMNSGLEKFVLKYVMLIHHYFLKQQTDMAYSLKLMGIITFILFCMKKDNKKYILRLKKNCISVQICSCTSLRCFCMINE